MKAVGEIMAIGRTFAEALQKGVRSLEIGISGFGSSAEYGYSLVPLPPAMITAWLTVPGRVTRDTWWVASG